MYLKVIGDPTKAQKLMGIKSPVKKGQILSGKAEMFTKLASENPTVFKVLSEGSNPLRPEKTKMIKSFKSK